jgi:hypothetical protein
MVMRLVLPFTLWTVVSAFSLTTAPHLHNINVAPMGPRPYMLMPADVDIMQLSEQAGRSGCFGCVLPVLLCTRRSKLPLINLPFTYQPTNPVHPLRLGSLSTSCFAPLIDQIALQYNELADSAQPPFNRTSPPSDGSTQTCESHFQPFQSSRSAATASVTSVVQHSTCAGSRPRMTSLRAK